jgi:succinate dehydrogenase / fumarate reductase flavoprotein subunit
LGTNSLVDIIVFGRRGGKALGEFTKRADLVSLPSHPQESVQARIERLRQGAGSETVIQIRGDLQAEMMDKVSVFRTKTDLGKGLETIRGLKQRIRKIRLQDRGMRYNTELLEAMELEYLLDLAEVTATCALNRTESRGAHYREDFPNRDDPNWLKHSLAFLRSDGRIDLRYKPVTITRFQPQERKY